MLFASIGVVLAQDDGTSSSSDEDIEYGAKAGDFSGAILYGRGLFITSGLNVPSSVTINSSVSGSSPNATNIIGEDNSATNMMGGEARYFITDRIAVKLGGAAIVRNTPDRINIQAPTGQISGNGNIGNAGAIPNYLAVQSQNDVDLTINVGSEYHFSSKYDRLFPYVGLNLPFYHARRSIYNPTVTTNTNGDVFIADIAPRHVQLMGFGAQAAAGVDYYLDEGFFFGFEIKPISYVYLYTAKFPAPGLPELEANTTTISFFTQPFLKIGFRF